MKLIIGLGNPDEAYVNTRHNAGFLVVDQLNKYKSANLQIYKSQNFMNESGDFVKKLLAKYPNISVSDIYIIHDDLDIGLGEFKIQFGRGPKDHNGILDVEEKLGTKEFWRVRIGVDNRHSEIAKASHVVPLDAQSAIQLGGEEYVLQNFSDEERKILDGVIKQACHQLIQKT